jgi:hypothetical protein
VAADAWLGLLQHPRGKPGGFTTHGHWRFVALVLEVMTAVVVGLVRVSLFRMDWAQMSLLCGTPVLFRGRTLRRLAWVIEGLMALEALVV